NHFTRQVTGPSLAKAVSLYHEAIEKSPNDARAWAGLAKAHASRAFYGHADVNEGHRLARQAGERARALDGGLMDAHLVMGWILASLEFRWKESMESLRRAVALAPGASEPLWTIGVYLGA